MARSSVAIIGRPNVGKSTLFNRLVGARIAIEDSTSGTTRDRILHPMEHEGRCFDLIDTGGIGIVDRQDLSVDVEQQIAYAIEEASVIVFLTDVRDGLTPLDREVADRLRRAGKPIILGSNKVDASHYEDAVNEFHALGFGDPLPLSGKNNVGIAELLDRILEVLPPTEPEPAYDAEVLKIAFVGKRNAGKSSIVNALAGAKRVIVSDKPGTTRDSVDILFTHEDGRRFVAIDTAGMRKRGKGDDPIEFYGQLRSERAIGRADVVALMIDASEPISKVDKRIGDLIVESYRPCILVINKWDLALAQDRNITLDAYHKYLVEHMPGLAFAPIVATTATTGFNVWNLIDVAQDLAGQARRHVTTGQLNRALQEAYEKQRPPLFKGRMFRIYYGTQAEVNPPTIIVFCNHPGLASDQYTRYMAGQLRKTLGFDEVPVRIWYRSSHPKDGEAES